MMIIIVILFVDCDKQKKTTDNNWKKKIATVQEKLEKFREYGQICSMNRFIALYVVFVFILYSRTH